MLIALLVAAAAQVAAATNPPFARVLLPLYLSKPVPGAFGSLWQSQFAMHNGSPDRSYTFQWCSPVDPNEGCILDLRDDEELVPAETQTALPGRYPAPSNGVAGAVLYFSASGIPPTDGSDISFDLRVADTSRSAITAGTEIPVVRERDFRTDSSIQLLNVPTDPKFRIAVRLFEMNLATANFGVQVYDQATNKLLSSSRVTTSAPPQGFLRFTPAFVDLGDLGIGTVTGPVRVQIVPLNSGVAFWAYVSITNNESQQITLVTPQ